MDCPDPGQAALRERCCGMPGHPDLRAALAAELGAGRTGRWLASAHILTVRRPGEDEVARLDIAEALAKLSARRSHAAALEEAVEDIDARRRMAHAPPEPGRGRGGRDAPQGDGGHPRESSWPPTGSRSTRRRRRRPSDSVRDRLSAAAGEAPALDAAARRSHVRDLTAGQLRRLRITRALH
jgi:DNA primase